MATVRGGKVRPHVQAFVDHLDREVPGLSFGTYNGHQPTIDRAVDIFHRIGDHATADAICRFALAHWEHYGLDYIISRQTGGTTYRGIYNPEISRSWRPMADRGGATQNHDDHAHVSFEPTGSASPVAPDRPAPPPKGKRMFRFWHEGGLYLTDGLHRSPHGMDQSHSQALDIADSKSSYDCPIVDLPADKARALFERTRPVWPS